MSSQCIVVAEVEVNRTGKRPCSLFKTIWAGWNIIYSWIFYIAYTDSFRAECDIHIYSTDNITSGVSEYNSYADHSFMSSSIN